MGARTTMRLVSVALALAGAVTGVAGAEVRLPNMLSDHAVLQRGQPIHIWGWAEPGEQVTVGFHEQRLAATADTLGKWSLWLGSEPAGGPYTLTVAGSGAPATLHDLMVGDVWFASGQSNMEFPLKGFGPQTPMRNGAEEIAKATQPGLRLLHVAQKSSQYPLDDQPATWTLCTPDTAATFSAVAYLFGREIHEREHVTVGLMDATWGGTPAAAWVSSTSLTEDAALMPVFAHYAAQQERQADVPALRAREAREDAAARAAGQPAPLHPWHPDPASWAPGGLFNGMVAPATGYSIKGVIWYQGESDSMGDRGPLYERTFSTLITDWRARWAEGDFPFLYVQISSFTSSAAEHWGTIRDAQRRTLKLRNTAMAVTLDVGNPDNVHPADKQTVGTRLALAARAMVYGEKLEWSGPLFRQATAEGRGMRIWFDHAEGLAAKGGALEGFEVAGRDRQFHPASAQVEHGTVLAVAEGLDRPVYVRYAWPNAPVANLVNGAGLPASTFTSEATWIAGCAPNYPGACAP